MPYKHVGPFSEIDPNLIDDFSSEPDRRCQRCEDILGWNEAVLCEECEDAQADEDEL